MGGLLSLERYIQGNHSGNSGSDSVFGSGNIIKKNIYYNYGSGSSSEDYTEILQQLYPPGSGYRSHRNRVPEPAEGTCTWVTDHPKYREWFENKTSGLLWLSADPGCGKSVIASFLVKHLEIQPDTLVCYFFFKDDSEEQKSAKFALRAILHQLFTQRKSLCVYAKEALDAKGTRFMEEVDTLWDILVKAVVEGGCGDVICVVDALDECDKVTIAPLIHHITRLSGPQTSDISLKFLVTSRPYHEIEKELGSPTTTIRLKGEDEIESITTDINRVIDEGIKHLESYWGQHGELGYLRNLLESSADRTFLWVSLVLDILKNSSDDSPEEFIAIVTTAPRHLAELYTKILSKSDNPDKARRILEIVVAAVRPLTLREMNVAFRIRRDHKTTKDLRDLPTGFEKTLKNLCGLFVRVIDSKIYLVHQTAREFLIKGSSAGQGNWQYTLSPMDSNFTLADICISYLLLEEFENDPLVTDTYTDIWDKAAGKKAIDQHLQKYSFLDYAASHWADHFRGSQNRGMELFQFTRQICALGSNRFLTWLEIHWRNSGRYDESPHDFTHLMIASWLGQQTVVERLLGEGGDLNFRSEEYGTALNVAAFRKSYNIARLLAEGGVVAYLSGKEFDILHTNRSELEALLDSSDGHDLDDLLAVLRVRS